MAEAMIAGLIHQNVAAPESLHAAGPREERLSELRDKYQIEVFTDNAEAAREADVVVLSVKPQRLGKVLEGLCGSLMPEALVLSIVAGATIHAISQGLDHARIVRAMPNTPAQIGEGITVWTAAPDAS